MSENYNVLKERGLRRFVNFSDAVVAIAATLLVLPLVDSASNIGSISLDEFFTENRTKLNSFALSFVVIAIYWWTQHQMFEGVRSYNRVLASGMFLWLLCIVFLPFPTELLSSTAADSTGVHAIYLGTIVVTSVAVLIQQWAVVRWPELQEEEIRGSLRMDRAVIMTLLLVVAFVVAIAAPTVGLWSLLIIVLMVPIGRVVSARRTR